MDLSKILSISGKSGLFQLIAQTKTGFIVESLVDNKRFSTHLTDKVNKLSDISIFTTVEDIPLLDVFRKIFAKENGGLAIDHKSDEKLLKKYFEEILPEYDKEKVYISDIKKLINWYNSLHKLDLLKEAIETKENEENVAKDEPAEQIIEEEKSSEEDETAK